MAKDLSRRKFLERIGLGTAAGAGFSLFNKTASGSPSLGVLPTRTLGRTGARVSILAFGCGSRFLTSGIQHHRPMCGWKIHGSRIIATCTFAQTWKTGMMNNGTNMLLMQYN